MSENFLKNVKRLKQIQKLENTPPEDEGQPFKEKYEARNQYISMLEDLTKSEDSSQEILFFKAVIVSLIGKNHFDTDENNDAGKRCRESLQIWVMLEDEALLFNGIGWIGMMLNYLGFHAIFGERFYEGILLLDSAEKIYKAVKGQIRRSEEDFEHENLKKEVSKLFLKKGVIHKLQKKKIGEYTKKEVLEKLKEYLKIVRENTEDPENTKGSSELIHDTRKMIKEFSSTGEEDKDYAETDLEGGFNLELCEENYVQSVFFQAQVYGKLMEKDLSAEYCGLTLQRQYFKFLFMKTEIESKKAKLLKAEETKKENQENEKTKISEVESNNDEKTIKEKKDESSDQSETSKNQNLEEVLIRNNLVPGFEYKDFVNNSMGLCMYYSEKLMFKQGSKLLTLADEILGEKSETENEEITLLRASLTHMKANLLRDFFMYTCLIVKESGSTRKESKDFDIL
jgi:hypothetical protein